MQLFCMCLAHHELESVWTIMIVITNAAMDQEGSVLRVLLVCLHAACQMQCEELP